VDLLALIINSRRKYIGVHIILGIIDIFIILAGGIAFGIENMIYAIIAILISTKLTDRIIQGYRQGKIVCIISSHCEEIKNAIIYDIERGVTAINVTGGFKSAHSVMLFSVMSSRNLVELKEIIRQIDGKSFLIVGSVTEVFGEGFTNLE
jgi:uncharacterized membrane-anchored protein YitT (DUF2179 family)